jgi:primary-amine oxidase
MSVPNATPGTATKLRSDVNGKPPTVFKHPLDPLTPEEVRSLLLTLIKWPYKSSPPQLTSATYAVRQYIATKTPIKAIKFIICNLLPPPKRAVLAHLGIPLEPGAKPEEPVPVVRKAEIDVGCLIH